MQYVGEIGPTIGAILIQILFEIDGNGFFFILMLVSRQTSLDASQPRSISISLFAFPHPASVILNTSVVGAPSPSTPAPKSQALSQVSLPSPRQNLSLVSKSPGDPNRVLYSKPSVAPPQFQFLGSHQ